MDGLLVKLSQCGVGCFIGTQFVGALAYADDIVLSAPSQSDMQMLRAICIATSLTIAATQRAATRIVFVHAL